MKQIRFLLVMLLAAMSVDAIAQNPIWKDPTNNVEYELNMDKKTASVKAGDVIALVNLLLGK
jgi:hypothetical protein